MTNNLWLHCRLYLQKHGRWSAYLKHTQRRLLSGRLCVLVGGCLLVCWLACGVRWSSLWCFTDGCLLASGLSRCGMQPPLYSPIFTLPPLPSVPLPPPPLSEGKPGQQTSKPLTHGDNRASHVRPWQNYLEDRDLVYWGCSFPLYVKSVMMGTENKLNCWSLRSVSCNPPTL